MYWLLVTFMALAWIAAAVTGWQEGLGLGGAVAGLLFLIPVALLWRVRDNPFE